MEEKEKRPKSKPKELSRREFLKDAGLVAGSAALGSMALVNACGSTTTVTGPGVTSTITSSVTSTVAGPGTTVTTTVTGAGQTITAPPVTTTVTPPPVTSLVNVAKSGCIAWDATKCVSCGRCLAACMAVHESGSSYTLSAIKWFENKWFDGWDGEVPAYPFFCQQCSSPECYFACPLKDKALCIDAKTGTRYINKANCNGCGICVLACPLSPPRINLDQPSKKAIKCDLCKDRTFREVAALKLTAPGSGYTSVPKVTFSGGGGSGATAVAQVGIPVASITVTAGGTGYTSAPTVSFSGGNGSGATATAAIANGAVTGVTITKGGTGYTAVPTVAFSGGGGTGAKATATLGSGPLTALIVAWPGSGYTSVPTVTISGGGGTGATGTSVVSTGQACIDVCDRDALKLTKAEERL